MTQLAYLLPDLLPQALRAITDADAFSRNRLLTFLAPHLPAPLLPHAYHAALTIRREHERAHVLENVLTCFPEEELGTRIQQAARTTTFG